MSNVRLSESAKAALRSGDALPPDTFLDIQATLTDPTRTQAEIQPSYHVAIQTKMIHDLIAALRKMDETSAGLSRKLVWLTWILVILTVVLAAEAAINLLTHGG
jgi:hypothetical protein